MSEKIEQLRMKWGEGGGMTAGFRFLNFGTFGGFRAQRRLVGNKRRTVTHQAILGREQKTLAKR